MIETKCVHVSTFHLKRVKNSYIGIYSYYTTDWKIINKNLIILENGKMFPLNYIIIRVILLITEN